MNSSTLQVLRNRLPALARQARCTVLDWTSTGVVISALQLVNHDWQVSESVWEPWPDRFDPFLDPRQTARLLQTWIDSRPWAAQPAVISLPRQYVSLRLLSFPIVAPTELAQLIALQLEARQSSPDAAQVWDFLQHSQTPGDHQLHVSLLAAPASICASIRQAVEAAGWKMPVLTAADLFISNPAHFNHSCQLTLQMNRSKLEVLASRNGLPAASFASAAPGLPNAAPALPVNALIERIAESLPENWRSEIPAQPILVCGSQTPLLTEQLQTAGFQVVQGLADERSPRAVAMARLAQSRSVHFNLLSPRSLNHSLYARKPALVRSIALALILLIAATAWLFTERSQRQLQLSQLLAKTERLQSRLAEHELVPEQRARLDAWTKSATSPAATLSEILALVPGEHSVLLTRVQLDNLGDGSESVLRLEGLAESPADVGQLNAAILQFPQRYTLRPNGIEPAPAESQLKLSFSTECVLLSPNTRNQDSAPVAEPSETLP